jgi:hypothetical protein
MGSSLRTEMDFFRDMQPDQQIQNSTTQQRPPGATKVDLLVIV